MVKRNRCESGCIPYWIKWTKGMKWTNGRHCTRIKVAKKYSREQLHAAKCKRRARRKSEIVVFVPGMEKKSKSTPYNWLLCHQSTIFDLVYFRKIEHTFTHKVTHTRVCCYNGAHIHKAKHIHCTQLIVAVESKALPEPLIQSSCVSLFISHAFNLKLKAHESNWLWKFSETK